MNPTPTVTVQELQAGQVQWQGETRIPIHQVQIPEDRIGADRYSEDDLLDLVASILANGLLSPIVVGHGWKLISGLNRLRAFRHITDVLQVPGYDTIPARTVITDTHTEVRIEADENLVRRQLGAADATAMIQAHMAAGLSRKASRALVSSQTGWSDSALRQAEQAEKRLENDIEDAYESGDPALVEAAKAASAVLASAPTKTEGIKGARSIIDAAQETVVPAQPAPRPERPMVTPQQPETQSAPEPVGGASVTDLTSRVRQDSTPGLAAEAEQDVAPAVPLPAPAAQSTADKAWARLFHVLAPEAAVLDDLDAADGAVVFAALSPEYQQQVLRVVEMVGRAAAQVEAAA